MHKLKTSDLIISKWPQGNKCLKNQNKSPNYILMCIPELQGKEAQYPSEILGKPSFGSSCRTSWIGWAAWGWGWGGRCIWGTDPQSAGFLSQGRCYEQSLALSTQLHGTHWHQPGGHTAHTFSVFICPSNSLLLFPEIVFVHEISQIAGIQKTSVRTGSLLKLKNPHLIRETRALVFLSSS